jgi:hypothetical protein
MNHDLHCLVYVSSATSEMSSPALELLLRKARMNNSNRGITGVLLYSGGNFMQVLEGPRDAVMDTYHRICLSKLHSGVTELTGEPVPCRQFAGWSMAYSRATWENLMEIQEAFAPGAASTGMELLKNFWSSSRAWVNTRGPATAAQPAHPPRALRAGALRAA